MEDLSIQLFALIRKGTVKYGSVEQFLDIVSKRKVSKKMIEGKKLLIKMLRNYIYLKQSEVA